MLSGREGCKKLLSADAERSGTGAEPGNDENPVLRAGRLADSPAKGMRCMLASLSVLVIACPERRSIYALL